MVVAIMNNNYEQYFGTETILLVDDEAMVRDAYCEFLNSCGYNVIVARDGLEALDMYINNQHDIDLVFSDILMPGKNGISVYKEIVSINPDVKYILMSGFTPVSMGVIDDRPFLKKPFEPIDVLKKIREIIDSGI